MSFIKKKKSVIKETRDTVDNSRFEQFSESPKSHNKFEDKDYHLGLHI